MLVPARFGMAPGAAYRATPAVATVVALAAVGSWLACPGLLDGRAAVLVILVLEHGPCTPAT